MAIATKQKYIITIIFMSVMSIIMLSAFVYVFKDVIAAYQSKSWSTVQGNVISSNYCRGCGKGASYYPAVTYGYSVGNRQFISDRITFSSVCGPKSDAVEIVNHYSPKLPVSVYFDAKNPERSVLIPGQVSGETWLGVALTFFGFLTAIFFIRKGIRELRAMD